MFDKIKKIFKKKPKVEKEKRTYEKAIDHSNDISIENDIRYMSLLSELIEKAHSNISINFDFCEIKGFDYENDIIFSAYIEHDSEEVAIGGKYDLNYDGLTGIGFSIDVRYLLKNQFSNEAKYKIVNKSGRWFTEVNDE